MRVYQHQVLSLDFQDQPLPPNLVLAASAIVFNENTTGDEVYV
jgi:hypothetical protein